MIFITVLTLVIAQRFYELKVAKHNTREILAKGGVEFGADHYWIIVLLHALFFISMVLEAFLRGVHPPEFWPVFFIIFMGAQLARVWIIRSMKGRWTTRILVIPRETLVSSGPFRFISHPNYTVVAIEILILPLLFGLSFTAMIFTLLNAIVLLFVRIPVERKALEWVDLTRKSE